MSSWILNFTQNVGSDLHFNHDDHNFVYMTFGDRKGNDEVFMAFYNTVRRIEGYERTIPICMNGTFDNLINLKEKMTTSNEVKSFYTYYLQNIDAISSNETHVLNIIHSMSDTTKLVNSVFLLSWDKVLPVDMILRKDSWREYLTNRWRHPLTNPDALVSRITTAAIQPTHWKTSEPLSLKAFCQTFSHSSHKSETTLFDYHLCTCVLISITVLLLSLPVLLRGKKKDVISLAIGSDVKGRTEMKATHRDRTENPLSMQPQPSLSVQELAKETGVSACELASEALVSVKVGSAITGHNDKDAADRYWDHNNRQEMAVEATNTLPSNEMEKDDIQSEFGAHSSVSGLSDFGGSETTTNSSVRRSVRLQSKSRSNGTSLSSGEGRRKSGKFIGGSSIS